LIKNLKNVKKHFENALGKYVKNAFQKCEKMLKM